MTQIKIEVPANDHIALSAMADALQRIAAERAPHEPLPSEMSGRMSSHLSKVEKMREDVINKYAKTSGDDELEESVHHENTKHDESFEEGEKLFDAEIARMDEECEAFEEAVDSTLDADGIPHDKRIHSKGATRLADNTWRLRKRPADKTEEEWTAYIDSVKAELKAVQDIPVTPPEAEFTEQQAIDVIGNANDNPMDIVEPTLDEQAVADLTPPVIETREGPFYWSHDESDSCGEVQTLEQLREMLDSDPLCNQIDKDSYDKRVEIGYDNGVNNVTPNGDVAIEPPVTAGAPVAPVTPPTSLTPPVVEADKPKVTTFQELMLYMTSDAKKRGADNDMIKATLLEVDPALTAIPLIATRADLIPKFVEALEAKLA